MQKNKNKNRFAALENETSLTRTVEFVVNFRFRYRARRNRIHKDKVRRSAVKAILDLSEKGNALTLTYKRIARMANLCLFILLIDEDLDELMTDMQCAIGQKRRRFVARQLAVLLYEAVSDLAELAGKNYRNELNDLHIPEKLWRDDLNEISRGFVRFKTQHSKLLADIRNMTAAHREHKAILQYKIISGIDPLEIVACAPEFQRVVDILAGLQTRLLSYSATKMSSDADQINHLMSQFPPDDE